MLRRVWSLAVTIVVAVSILAACGSDDDEAEPTATRMPATNVPATGTQTVGAGASPVAQGSPAVSEVGNTVAIEMQDIRFRPAEVTIPASTAVTVMLANTGAANHNFNVDDLDLHSGDYESGKRGSLTITAAPGEYEFHCSIPGHEAAGMVGKLIVR